MEKTNKQEHEEVIVTAGKIVLPKIDVTQYIGKRLPIEKVTTHKGQHGYYVKIASAIVDTIGNKDRPTELRATRIIGLQEDAQGNIGWGEGTAMDKYLTKMDVAHFTDLVGKEIVVQKRTADTGAEFLTFD